MIYSFNEEQPAYIIKICLLGQAGVGKTCVCKRLAFNIFDINSKPTIGLDFYKKDLPIIINKEKKIIRLSIWDFGGQEQFKDFFHYYISGAHGIFMLFELTNLQSLIQLDWWHQKLIEYNHGNTIKMHIGTKLDLIDENDKKIQSNELIIKRFLKKHEHKDYIKTSSKEDININYIYKEMVKLILENYNFKYDSLP